MAELPDLTVFAQILQRRFAGKKLKNVEVKVAKKLKIPTGELVAAIGGKKLVSVCREGKTLQLHFDNGNVLGIHLMLRGELVEVFEEEVPKYLIIAFRFVGGEGFSVVDILKQATLMLNPEPAKAPDALEMTKDYFITLLTKKKKMVKAVLMDQKLIRGIGNSYADEILWDAKVSPFSIASALPDKVAKVLFASLQAVLKKAIKEIGKENGDELRGELRDFMNVHGSKIEKSPSGAIIMSEKISGRVAYYTQEQKLYD